MTSLRTPPAFLRLHGPVLGTALLLAATLAGAGSLQPPPTAQVAQPLAAAAADTQESAPSVGAGRTRAAVVAELACARASGEMDALALEGYGLAGRPVDRSVPACAEPRGTAVAGAPAR